MLIMVFILKIFIKNNLRIYSNNYPKGLFTSKLNKKSKANVKYENLIKIKDVDLNNFEVSLLINDTIVDTGNTKNVLDNPLNAVLWLINNLAEKGEPMLKGQFISSGSCTKAFRIYPKSKIKAEFNQLGSIEFEYI